MKNLAMVVTGLVLALISGIVAQAQVSLGVKAGVNINSSQLKEPAFDYKSSSVGFNAGLLAEVNISHKWYIRPELLYAQKGWNETSMTVPTFYRKMELHYVTLPVLAAFRVIPKLSVMAGPEIGYLLKTTTSPQTSISLGDIYNKWDLGIALGAAFQLTSQLGLEARYIYGLSPIYTLELTDENGSITGTMSNGYNRVLQAGLFYRFGQKQ
jgi:opacity protein-like surface antigen